MDAQYIAKATKAVYGNNEKEIERLYESAFNSATGYTGTITFNYIDAFLEDKLWGRNVTTNWIVSQIKEEQKWKTITKHRKDNLIRLAYYLGRNNEKNKENIPSGLSFFSDLPKVKFPKKKRGVKNE